MNSEDTATSAAAASGSAEYTEVKNPQRGSLACRYCDGQLAFSALYLFNPRDCEYTLVEVANTEYGMELAWGDAATRGIDPEEAGLVYCNLQFTCTECERRHQFKISIEPPTGRTLFHWNALDPALSADAQSGS